MHITGVRLYAQLSELGTLKKYYSDYSSENDSCGGLRFAQSSDSIIQIVLIRHGKPQLNKKGWFSAADAQKYSDLYDRVEVYDFSPSPFCFDENDLDTLYSSDLIRAVSTATKILGESDIVLQQKTLFREFEREVFPFPVLKMPLNFWLVTSRLMWYSGLHSRRIESSVAAGKRVDLAAEFLEKKSQKNGKTALVAHGMFNKRLAKTLRRNGWTMVYQNGNGYLSLRILAKSK
jgi:broad specificity phosphatase PhoE